MWDKFKAWLFKPAKTTGEKIIVTQTAFLINVLWLVGIAAFLTYINQWSNSGLATFFYACIMAPLWEEFVFRVLPIQIARHFSDKLILPIVGISSLIFGWGHGNGTNSLLIQGVGGLLLSTVYIKTNYNYWAAVAMHAAWNIWVIYFVSF